MRNQNQNFKKYFVTYWYKCRSKTCCLRHMWESLNFAYIFILKLFCSVVGGYWQVGKQVKSSRPPAVVDPHPNARQHSRIELKRPPPHPISPPHSDVLTVISHLSTAVSSWKLWTLLNHTHLRSYLFRNIPKILRFRPLKFHVDWLTKQVILKTSPMGFGKSWSQVFSSWNVSVLEANWIKLLLF